MVGAPAKRIDARQDPPTSGEQTPQRCPTRLPIQQWRCPWCLTVTMWVHLAADRCSCFHCCLCCGWLQVLWSLRAFCVLLLLPLLLQHLLLLFCRILLGAALHGWPLLKHACFFDVLVLQEVSHFQQIFTAQTRRLIVHTFLDSSSRP